MRFGGDSMDLKSEVLVSFSIVKSDCRATSSPSTPIISRNTSNQNYEIVILLNIFLRSSNYVFGDDKPPRPSGQGL